MLASWYRKPTPSRLLSLHSAAYLVIKDISPSRVVARPDERVAQRRLIRSARDLHVVDLSAIEFFVDVALAPRALVT